MIKCPKCNEEMEELEQDYSSMTEGQQADYDGGFNRPFQCPKCKIQGLYEVPIYDEDYERLEDIYEEIEYLKTTPKGLDWLIKPAYEKECYIEAISLIHNVIEIYLKAKLKEFFQKEKEKLSLIEKLKWLKDANQLCYLLGLIEKEDFEEINDFNAKRNNAIHDLLKLKTHEERSEGYEKLKDIAKKGRKIQIKLSPSLNEETKSKISELKEEMSSLEDLKKD